MDYTAGLDPTPYLTAAYGLGLAFIFGTFIGIYQDRTKLRKLQQTINEKSEN